MTKNRSGEAERDHSGAPSPCVPPLPPCRWLRADRWLPPTATWLRCRVGASRTRTSEQDLPARTMLPGTCRYTPPFATAAALTITGYWVWISRDLELRLSPPRDLPGGIPECW